MGSIKFETEREERGARINTKKIWPHRPRKCICNNANVFVTQLRPFYEKSLLGRICHRRVSFRENIWVGAPKYDRTGLPLGVPLKIWDCYSPAPKFYCRKRVRDAVNFEDVGRSAKRVTGFPNTSSFDHRESDAPGCASDNEDNGLDHHTGVQISRSLCGPHPTSIHHQEYSLPESDNIDVSGGFNFIIGENGCVYRTRGSQSICRSHLSSFEQQDLTSSDANNSESAEVQNNRYRSMHSWPGDDETGSDSIGDRGISEVTGHNSNSIEGQNLRIAASNYANITLLQISTSCYSRRRSSD